MKRTFLIGVAAGALLAGANLASAQTMERGGGAEQRGGAATEQRGTGGGAEQRNGGAAEQRGRAGGELNANSPAGNARAQGQAQENMKATTGQGQQGQKAQDAQKQDNRAQDNKAQDNNAHNAQSGPDSKSGTSAQGDDKAKSSTSAQDRGSGQAGGGKAVNLNTEQKTKIRETVIRSSNAPRVTNVNFSVSVGTVVPRTVRYAPLPPVLVEVYPDWRGYDYIIVSERIVILEPGSLRIVAVLDV